jgi:hypothetical protein
LDSWHALPEVYDDALDAQIHSWYAELLRKKPLFPPYGVPYFSPSSASSCPRELYEKLRKSPKDTQKQSPHQGRWKRIGTEIGTLIQRDILFAEKHYAKATGEQPRFTFERNADGTPMFEGFAKKAHMITHNGVTFALYGAPDGIMRYVTDDGEIIRVGLEIKSKQGSHSKTSDYSMREAESSHVKQSVVYSEMYGVDFYVVLYVNASKKAWNMTEDDYAKNPDMRAFGIAITNAQRTEIFDGFADILKAVGTECPPPLDIDKWTFNNFKRTCAMSLTESELADIERQVNALMRSNLPDYKKRQPAEALADILRIRVEKESEVIAV